MINSLQVNTFNRGKYPVVDRNGKAFTPGCAVKFRTPTSYINTTEGVGVVRYISDSGYITVESNKGLVHCPTRYQYSGPLYGHRVAKTYLGDPFEHGTTECFVECVEENVVVKTPDEHKVTLPPAEPESGEVTINSSMRVAILQSYEFLRGHDIVLAFDVNKKEFVTWERNRNNGCNEYFFGHYFEYGDVKKAIDDYYDRVKDNAPEDEKRYF